MATTGTFNAPDSSLMPFFLISVSLLEISVALESPCTPDKVELSSCTRTFNKL